MEIFVFFGIAGVALLGTYLANRGRGDEYRGSATILPPPGEGNDPWQDELFHSRSLGPLSRVGEDDGLFRDAGSDWTFDDAPDLINDPIYRHLPGNVWYSSSDDSLGLGTSLHSQNIFTDINYFWMEGNIYHQDDAFSQNSMFDHDSMFDHGNSFDHDSMFDHGGFGTGSDPFDND